MDEENLEILQGVEYQRSAIFYNSSQWLVHLEALYMDLSAYFNCEVVMVMSRSGSHLR